MRDKHCRACLAHLSLHGSEAQGEPFTQLWFGVSIPSGLRIRHHPLRLDNQRGDRAGREIDPSAHIARPGQLVLFTVRRGWSPLVGRRTEEPSRVDRVGADVG